MFQGDLCGGADERDGQSGQPSDNGGDKGGNVIDFFVFVNVEFQEMIAEEDPDGDGVITKDEFTKMLDKNNRKSRHCNNVSSSVL